jgi:hypothetical protein
MGFKDFEGFSFKHVNNPLNPNTDQRSNFDSRGDELAAYIKSFIIDVLNSTANGTSGADNLGATPITDGAPSTTQGVLSWLYTQILEVSRAGVADGAITDSKLADKDIQIFTDAIINNIKFSNVDTNTVLMGLKGRTIINLLGSDGDCEDISKWTALSVTLTLDSTTKVFGNNSIKVTNTSTAWGNANKNIDNIVDKTKYYCFSVYAKPGQSSGSSILLYNGDGDIGTSVSTAKTTDITKFTRVFLKVKPSDFGASGNILKSSALDNVAGSYANIDGVMINEITEAEYNGSSYVPPEYVNDDTSVVNPVIVSSGKNKFNKRDANITYGNIYPISLENYQQMYHGLHPAI